MINISIAGIGGQGSVLAARILAEAALARGWQVRTCETMGMAQRGGDVTSHVRMGNKGEQVHSPLPAKASVDVLIALEPGEGARNLPLLRKGGLLVTATTGQPPATADLKAAPYDADAIIAELRRQGVNLLVVDDQELCGKLGSRKALNIVMLAITLAAVSAEGPYAGNTLAGQLGIDEMRQAVRACVKPRFVEMNMEAIDLAQSYVSQKLGTEAS
ncbi:MAG: indolepyruvate oxidoreductase subunit beta [Coriobacteriia bacterium]|nr:indolepyruvate oxidoreductase subunit beta [Coriobacteriia bacterium]